MSTDWLEPSDRIRYNAFALTENTWGGSFRPLCTCRNTISMTSSPYISTLLYGLTAINISPTKVYIWSALYRFLMWCKMMPSLKFSRSTKLLQFSSKAAEVTWSKLDALPGNCISRPKAVLIVTVRASWNNNYKWIAEEKQYQFSQSDGFCSM